MGECSTRARRDSYTFIIISNLKLLLEKTLPTLKKGTRHHNCVIHLGVSGAFRVRNTRRLYDELSKTDKYRTPMQLGGQLCHIRIQLAPGGNGERNFDQRPPRTIACRTCQ